MSTTTYVARVANEQGFETRTSKTMNYTHAVVGPWEGEEAAYTWHTSRQLATKALATRGTGFRVVEVEAHEGGKDKVTKALIAAAPAPAPAAKTSARTWNAQASGTHKCEGDCAEVKPAAAFPTTKQAGRRGVECRKCRNARLDRRG